MNRNPAWLLVLVCLVHASGCGRAPKATPLKNNAVQITDVKATADQAPAVKTAEVAAPVYVDPYPERRVPGSRMWTKRDNSAQFRGWFLSLEGDKVRLKRFDQEIVKVPLEMLSQADRDWIKQHGQESQAANSQP